MRTGEPALKLAIVGRPNAGKSTLINRHARRGTADHRARRPGSPAIRSRSTGNGARPTARHAPVRLIDTAGMRKKAKVEDKLEKLSVADARRAVDFAEVVVLLLDGTRGLEAQDLRIADHVLQEGRALIIAINKWDVAEGPSSLFNGIKAALDEGLARRAACRCSPSRARPARASTNCSPPPSRCARPGRSGCRPASSTAGSRRRSRRTRRPRRAARGSSCATSPRSIRARRASSCSAPGVDQLPESYLRYLVNGIRRELGFGAVPVRLQVRASRNPFGERGRK